MSLHRRPSYSGCPCKNDRGDTRMDLQCMSIVNLRHASIIATAGNNTGADSIMLLRWIMSISLVRSSTPNCSHSYPAYPRSFTQTSPHRTAMHRACQCLLSTTTALFPVVLCCDHKGVRQCIFEQDMEHLEPTVVLWDLNGIWTTGRSGQVTSLLVCLLMLRRDLGGDNHSGHPRYGQLHGGLEYSAGCNHHVTVQRSESEARSSISALSARQPERARMVYLQSLHRCL